MGPIELPRTEPAERQRAFGDPPRSAPPSPNPRAPAPPDNRPSQLALPFGDAAAGPAPAPENALAPAEVLQHLADQDVPMAAQHSLWAQDYPGFPRGDF